MKELNNQKIEELLRSATVETDPKWVSVTRKNLENYSKNFVTNLSHERNQEVDHKVYNNLFFNFFVMTKKQIAIASVVGVVVTASLATGGLLLINNLRNTTSSTNLALTEEQKKEIYSNILANNSAANLKPQDAAKTPSANAAPRTNLAEAAGDLSILPYPMPFPVTRDYTFSKSISTNSTGPKAEACKMYGASGFYANSTSEYYDYYQNNGEASFSKHISRNPQGQLFNYYLNTAVANKSESYTYFGGQYAVKSTYDFSPLYYDEKFDVAEIMPSLGDDQPMIEPDLMPVPSIQDPLEYIKMLYGEDVDIVDLRNENGREVYVLSYSYEVDCNSTVMPYFSSSMLRDGSQQNADMRRIFSEVMIDTATFQTLGTTTYLDSIADANMISKYLTQFETSNMSLEEARSFFQFEFSVPVRELVYPEYSQEKELAAQRQAFESGRLPIYTVSLEGFNLQYSWVYYEQDYAPNINYWSDRDFYPSGSFGDALFQENNFASVGAEFTKQLVNYSYSKGSWETADFQSYDISIYDSADLEKILNEMNGWRDQASVSRTNRVVNINGVSVDAIQIKTEDRYSFPRIALDGTTTSEFEDQVWTYYTTYLIHAGRVVAITFSDANGSQMLPDNFELSSVSFGEANYESEKQRVYDSWSRQNYGVAEMPVEAR